MADSTDYKRWLKRAKEDLNMLHIIYNDGLDGMEDSFCYICHQAAEKLLKAFLIKNEELELRTHSLVFLLNKCLNYEDSLLALMEAVATLNAYSVSARYPDDFAGDRTIEEAKGAYDYLLNIKDLIFPLMKNS